MGKSGDRRPHPPDEILPCDLPDKALDNQPLPWRIYYAGTVHFIIYDRNGAEIFRINVPSGKETGEFRKKLEKIHGSRNIDELFC